ncbi:MAG: hypothetical protein RL418_892 [Actinomycetota bacterium]|jgi:hypothetical protein
MKQYSSEEILNLLSAEGGDELEQAAALAVVASAIKESRRLGRIALRKPKTSWHKNSQMLRSEISESWSGKSLRGM